MTLTDKIVFSADAFGTYGTLDGGVIDYGDECGALLGGDAPLLLQHCR